jgi:hypothetical protein
MRFKDNELIWKQYNKTLNEGFGDMGRFDDDDNMDEGDIVMSFDEPSEVEFDSGPDDDHDLDDMEDNDLDIAIFTDIKKLAEYSQRILDICKEKPLEPWMVAQLVKASDYVSDVWHQLDAGADFANTGFEQADNFEL